MSAENERARLELHNARLRAGVESLRAENADLRVGARKVQEDNEALRADLAAVRTDLSVARGVVSELLQWITDVSDKPWRLHDRDQRVAEAHVWLRATPPVAQLPPTDT